MYREVMVLMPRRMVCFWTGSGPILEKFDLGIGGRGVAGGVSSLSQLSYRFLYFHFEGENACVSWISPSDFGQSGVSQEEMNPVVKKLYQPISTTA